MGPEDWIKMATDIENNYLSYDGFVIIMGTDTMAYASSALSFMLENLAKTVVFTGSQIPFANVYTDARRNLVVSMIVAVSCECPEVLVCFNDKVMRANRTMKVDSSSLDAFQSPNFPPLANLTAQIRFVRDLALLPPRGVFRAHKRLEANVVVIKLVPGFDDSSIKAMIEHSTSLKAIVLELYGTGNAPSRKGSLIATLKAAKDKGIVIVGLSQCLRGGMSFDTYAMGRELSAAGVISGGDMTTEACTTKLSYLCGHSNNPAVISRYVSMNIRGELSLPGEDGAKPMRPIIPTSRLNSRL